jgi:hypothetical protein
MPSQIAHVLAGRAALKAASPVFGILGMNPVLQAFNLGCQGPDIFSHNRRTKPLGLMYSRLLHRQDFGKFCATISDRFAKNPSPEFFSWLYGFVTHQAVDRLLHPWIVYRSWVAQSTGIPGVSPALFHAFLERIFDVALLAQLEGLPVACFNTGSPFCLDADDSVSLAQDIAWALAHTYAINEEEIVDAPLRVSNAFEDAIFFYDLTNPVRTSYSSKVDTSRIRSYEDFGIGGVALLYPERLDAETDWLNIARESWEHPVTGKRTNASVPELFSQAVEIAAGTMDCVSRVLSGSVSPSALEKNIGNGCLSVSGDDGRLGQVSYYKPFDLSRILLEEAERRRAWIGA